MKKLSISHKFANLPSTSTYISQFTSNSIYICTESRVTIDELVCKDTRKREPTRVAGGSCINSGY